MGRKLWVARACDGRDTVICALEKFEDADKVGRTYCRTHNTSFYLRLYYEADESGEKPVPELLRELANRLECEER